MAEQVALKNRDSCSEKLAGSMRQLERYLDGEKRTTQLLQQKIDRVDLHKEELITSHHAYCVKANHSVSEPEMKEYIDPIIDRAVDLLDRAEEEIDTLNEGKTAEEQAREDLATKATELAKARSCVTSHTDIIREALNKLNLHSDGEEPNEIDFSYAESLIKDIRVREQELISSWNQVRSFLTRQAEIDAVSNEERELRKTIYESCTKGQLFISGRTNDEHDDASSSVSHTSTTRRSAHIEKMKPPKFSGSIRDFARFKSDFDTIVVPDSPSEYHQLYTMKERCLVGEPHDLVKNINNLNDAWKRLSDRYGDHIEIVDSVNQDLSNATIPKQNSDKGFVDFVKILEEGVQDLEAISSSDQIANAYTVRIIEKKLPRRVLQKWLDVEQDEDGEARFKQMLTFLKQERKQVEKIVIQRAENERDTAGGGGRRGGVHALGGQSNNPPSNENNNNNKTTTITTSVYFTLIRIILRENVETSRRKPLTNEDNLYWTGMHANYVSRLPIKVLTVLGSLNYREVEKVIRTLKDKKAAVIPNEIYKHAGEGLVREMTRVINWIKNNASTPEEWNKVVVATLFKNKGSKKILVNFRGIFLTVSFSKIFEKLIKTRHEDNFKNVSTNQNGATNGKSPADNVFLVNACIDHSKYLNKALYLGFYDFEQCFDKLWLEDCIVGLWNIGVRDQMLPLILSLNEEAEVVVKTPCGKTESFTVKRIVKQGTVIGPQLCKVSTAEYGEDTPGFQIGSVNIKPPIFVDDILTICGNIADSYESHEKVVFFQIRKRSKFGKTKCVLIVVNGKLSDVSPVLEIEDHVMSQVQKTKYVGDVFNQQGSNSDLIEDRVRKGTGKMISILALCEESGLGRYTVLCEILLYKTMFVQMVIFNCQGWSHLTQENLITLERLQLKFLKLILWLPLSTSNTFIFLEFGILPLSHEIQKRRLIFLHHILTLPDRDPVLLTYQQGLRLKYEPNWANDISRSRKQYSLDEQTDEEI